jgi:hypothetical protein
MSHFAAALELADLNYLTSNPQSWANSDNQAKTAALKMHMLHLLCRAKGLFTSLRHTAFFDSMRNSKA